VRNSSVLILDRYPESLIRATLPTASILVWQSLAFLMIVMFDRVGYIGQLWAGGSVANDLTPRLSILARTAPDKSLENRIAQRV